jgi:outer membrane lipoprotein carrier protein
VKKVFFFILLTFLSLSLNSLAVSKEALLSLFENVDALKMEFSQITELPVAGDTVSLYKGVIYYKRPLKFRWEYTEGSSSLIVSDGHRVLVNIEGDCQVMELDNNALFPFIELLENREEFLRRFGVREERDRIVVIPKDGESVFKEIAFVFKGGKLVRIETLQEGGTRSVYEIKSIEKNVKLSDDLFRVSSCEG